MMMKYTLSFALAAGLFTASCGNESTAVEAEVGDEVATGTRVAQALSYNVVPASSSINWTGSKLVGDSHTGTLSITEGTLEVAGNEITGGNFVIDMNSLANTDLDEDSGRGKLEGHLKGADFFDTETYPTATFIIASASPVSGTQGVTHELVGNLKMRDATKSIKIPVNVSITDNMVEATTPPFGINRTDWGVQYGSGLAGAVGDNVISDEVELQINLTAQKS